MARARTKKKPHKSFKVALLVVALLLLIGGAGGVYLVYTHDTNALEAAEHTIAEQADDWNVLRADIGETLQTDVGVAKIYDTSGNMLFTLRNVGVVEGVPEVPSVLAQAIAKSLIGSIANTPVNLEAWKESHTFMSQLQGELTIAQLTSGSLGWQAVKMYEAENGLMLANDTRLVLAAHMDNNLSAVDIIRYIASASSFGSIKGAAAAAEQLFNQELIKLSELQLNYLGYAFQNPEASWADFAHKHPEWTGGATTAEQFGFESSGGDTMWLIRQKVSQELYELLGTSSFDQDIVVKLNLNSQLQADLQLSLDNALRSSIDIGANGQPIMNGTLMVIDANTGYITALVGGRSISTSASKFMLNDESHVGNMVEAARLMAADTTLTGNSLIPYRLATGEVSYTTFYDAVMQDRIDLVGGMANVSAVCDVDEMSQFVASLYVGGGIKYINQIQSATGGILYQTTPGLDVKATGSNPDIRCLIAGDPIETVMNYGFWTDTGLTFGTANSEVIVCGVIGSNAAGFELSTANATLCDSAMQAAWDVATRHYQKIPKSVGAGGTVEEKIQQTHVKNAQIVVDIANGLAKELEEFGVNSVATRLAFEGRYTECVQTVNTYSDVIAESLLTDLLKQLEDVRIARTPELMQYLA